MPTYEYECKSCGYTFDVFQSMSDEPLKSCPECGKDVRRLINGGGGIIFKGSGFYVTDRGKGGGKDAEKKPAEKTSTDSGSSAAAPAPAASGPSGGSDGGGTGGNPSSGSSSGGSSSGSGTSGGAKAAPGEKKVNAG
ncbi:MAG: zinc ribbon domain-containing protein [Treponema sp.]|jgi:putative FmdB family regulatory protein|nr:zinc ribbon domain-containing protein [Treponema sp.]